MKIPEFLPGMGTLYVDPATLPAGPFLAYDHDANLVSTIYMVPLADLEAQKELSALKTSGEKVDLSGLEQEFVDAAAAYSARKGISYAAWRELGVEPGVLKRAGIPRSS